MPSTEKISDVKPPLTNLQAELLRVFRANVPDDLLRTIQDFIAQRMAQGNHVQMPTDTSKSMFPEALNSVQIELLRTSNADLPEEDIHNIRVFISTLLLERAHDEADKLWEERGYTQATMDEWLHSHFRTPYKPNNPAYSKGHYQEVQL